MKESRLLFPVVFLASAAIVFALFWERLRGGHPPVPPPDDAATASAPELPVVSAIPPEPIDAGPPAPQEPTAPSYVHVNPASIASCGPGMVLVDGVYCPYVGHSCETFVDETKDICARYRPDVLCEGRLSHRKYCIDVYEYPNIAGVVPAVMMDWDDANRACEVEGKRLCTVEEWEFACEGPQMWPYPYGIERDKTACNIDRGWTEPVLEAFSNPWKVSEEIERLDRRVPSGSLERCVSPFGVHDMTGNVDEWVLNRAGKADEKPYKSTLKGGYWGPVRARCRPITSTHNEWFSFYQVGLRCCKDVAGSPASGPAPGAKIPKKSRMASP